MWLSGWGDWGWGSLRVERRGGEESPKPEHRENTGNPLFCKLIRLYDILRRIWVEISSMGAQCASLKSPKVIKNSRTRCGLSPFKVSAREVPKTIQPIAMLLVARQDLVVQTSHWRGQPHTVDTEQRNQGTTNRKSLPSGRLSQCQRCNAQCLGGRAVHSPALREASPAAELTHRPDPTVKQCHDCDRTTQRPPDQIWGTFPGEAMPGGVQLLESLELWPVSRRTYYCDLLKRHVKLPPKYSCVHPGVSSTLTLPQEASYGGREQLVRDSGLARTTRTDTNRWCGSIESRYITSCKTQGASRKSATERSDEPEEEDGFHRTMPDMAKLLHSWTP